MADQVRNIKSSLFKSLRLLFWSEVVSCILFSVLVFYYRSRVVSLESSVKFLAASNIAVMTAYSSSVDFLTNQYFNASSSFASNVLFSAAGISSNSFSSVVLDSPAVPSAVSPSADSLPIQFNGYFEISGKPYIKVRSKCYKVGDILLGFPIEGISPDVVEYRGKYWKVDHNEKPLN